MLNSNGVMLYSYAVPCGQGQILPAAGRDKACRPRKKAKGKRQK